MVGNSRERGRKRGDGKFPKKTPLTGMKRVAHGFVLRLVGRNRELKLGTVPVDPRGLKKLGRLVQ